MTTHNRVPDKAFLLQLQSRAGTAHGNVERQAEMRKQRLVLALFMVATLAGGALARPPHARAAEACFPETGFCIQGRFLDYWTANGGLARNGYPLSDERRERLEGGNEYTVQYFERVRLEYHPENPPPYDVLLGQFGRRVLRDHFNYDVTGYQATIAPVAPLPGQTRFPETGHNLGGGFLDYWQANGGLAQFGYPLTEAFEQYLPAAGRYTVQYFERARLEYHPENAAPYNILLGQFGRSALATADFLTGRFGTLYLTDPRVRELLGPPTSPPTPTQGATRTFERGRMIYKQVVPDAVGTIYVLCGDLQAGTVSHPRGEESFLDIPRLGGPTGGGPGPQPGLYEPGGGFGTVWRENNEVRDCLGYATSPEETAYPLTWQAFERGIILSVPDTGVADVLWREDEQWTRIRYAQFALPAR